MLIRSFDRSVEQYEEYAVLQKTVAGRLLERLDLIRIKPRWIVDIGAGTGTTAHRLEKKYKSARVLQIDISRGMLKHSRRQKKMFFSRQHYVQADMENVPLEDNSADLVISSLAYQWSNDLDVAFTEACRVLGPNGPFIFTILGPDTLKELRACWAAVDGYVHVNDFIDMHDVGDALGRVGFQGVVMDVEMITLEYTDCVQLMRELKKVGAHNINASRKKTLTGKNRMQRMIREYEKFRCNGRLPVTYEVVYGLAWKPAARQIRQQGGISYVPVDSIGKGK